MPFLILATCLNMVISFGMTNSQLREAEIRGVLTVVFSIGPTSALILRCLYDIVPVFIKPSVYAPGCLDAINRALFIAPFFWLALAIFKDYWDNRITQKNVFLNDLVDEKSGNMKSDKEMFKDRSKKTKINPLAQNIGEEVPPEEDNEEEEINGLTEQIILANQKRTDIPIQASRISMLFKNDNNSFYALKDVSIILDKNETLGLLGPNGAGKSTLFNIISTYHDATGGSIRTFGEELNTYSSFFTECGLCAQDNILWDNLSISAQLNCMRILRGVPYKVQYKWLEFLEMTKFVGNTPSGLSSGMQRKVCFMMAAMSNPTFKFLDEPTTGLDPLSRKRFRELLDSQKQIYGGSSVFTTHTMSEAEKICDRIAILINGTFVVIDRVENIKKMTKGFNLIIYKNSPLDMGNKLKQLIGTQVFPEIPVKSI